MTDVLEKPRTHVGIRSIAEVTSAASAFRSVARVPDRETGWGGRAWYFTVGPGAVKLGARGIDTSAPLHHQVFPDNVGDNGGMGDDERAPKRGAISGWSQKSRNRMRFRLGSLDYTPLFRKGLMLPKMVTLTLPHNWEWLAPDARTFKRKLVDVAVKQKFRRHWGYDLQGVWKLEFQDRKVCKETGCHDPKAPHLHILMAPPSGVRPGTGETFEEWLRATWSVACAHPDDDAAKVRDHYLKGVHLADSYGLSGTDSKRIADYFVKHGVFAAKEYQNTAPKLWEGEDGLSAPGRYWGYWGLKIAEGEQFLGVDGAGEGAPMSDDRLNDIMSA